MKLGYQQATISFCEDFSSPNAASFPVASLVIGEAEGQQVAGVAVIIPPEIDPISRAVLEDTHQLIRRYVDEAFKARAPRSSLGDVLARVYHSLRNTMHVSVIAGPAEMDIDAQQLGGSIIALLRDGLEGAMRTAPTVNSKAESSTADVSSLPLLPSFLWAPPGPAHALHI